MILRTIILFVIYCGLLGITILVAAVSAIGVWDNTPDSHFLPLRILGSIVATPLMVFPEILEKGMAVALTVSLLWGLTLSLALSALWPVLKKINQRMNI